VKSVTKEKHGRQEGGDLTAAQVLFRKESLRRGSSCKRPKPTAAYRLGVDRGGAGGKVPRMPLLGNQGR
jgi:hypothetical protein